MSSDPKKPAPAEDPLRPHTFDGIAEYDKRLPNWWLLTFYGAIVFSIVYWFYYAQSGIPKTDQQEIDEHMAAVQAAKLAAVASLDDSSLWQMSRSAKFVDAGRETFVTNCASCHLPSLRGKDESPTAIGPNLVDTKWIHGGRPLDINKTINEGVLVKGMPAWGPILGQNRVSEVVAYILSHHKEGEPVEAVEN
ncbi:cbb3-type cytochrome c oxidase N-terminal domain-containing protein [Nibricoccus sp. IMCC34717]|uniref:cbb3-type cytochrome c oxidase N-terminal domain-containing protein n=1 Tax=Nibricoccus sp. IMCC34717 TaxID=3034021 RepID=UPI00384A4C22